MCIFFLQGGEMRRDGGGVKTGPAGPSAVGLAGPLKLIM